MAVFGSIWEDIRHSFRTGSMVTRLMIINFAVFAAANIAYFLLWLILKGDTPEAALRFEDGLRYFCMPGDWQTLLWRPWALVTSMFLHEAFGHFLGNIISLYIFGTIVGDLVGDRRVFPIYLLGGLVGNLLYFASAQFLPYVGTYALGASGAIMALAGAVLILAPDYRVMLMLLGEVRVKYIVLVMVLLDLVGIASQTNTGGHAAHIGGFLFGCWFVYQLRDGKDYSESVNRLLNRLTGLFSGRGGRPKRPAKTAIKARMEPPRQGAAGGREMPFQEKLDAILEKIKAQGYENLTQEEKDFLYEASKK